MKIRIQDENATLALIGKLGKVIGKPIGGTDEATGDVVRLTINGQTIAHGSVSRFTLDGEWFEFELEDEMASIVHLPPRPFVNEDALEVASKEAKKQGKVVSVEVNVLEGVHGLGEVVLYFDPEADAIHRVETLDRVQKVIAEASPMDHEWHVREANAEDEAERAASKKKTGKVRA